MRRKRDHPIGRVMKGDALSEGEQLVLLQVAQGYSNEEISRQLGIGIDAVKMHKARALNKLGLDNRVDLTRLLRHRGGLRRVSYPRDAVG